MIKFNKIYFTISIFLFLIEILIAKYATGFLRHTIGDYLCVILLYTFIKSFIKIDNLKIALFVLLISYVVEFLQLTDLQKIYPSEYSKILKLLFGTSFSVGDLVAYTLGILSILVLENFLKYRYKEVR